MTSWFPGRTKLGPSSKTSRLTFVRSALPKDYRRAARTSIWIAKRSRETNTRFVCHREAFKLLVRRSIVVTMSRQHPTRHHMPCWRPSAKATPNRLVTISPQPWPIWCETRKEFLAPETGSCTGRVLHVDWCASVRCRLHHSVRISDRMLSGNPTGPWSLPFVFSTYFATNENRWICVRCALPYVPIDVFQMSTTIPLDAVVVGLTRNEWNIFFLNCHFVIVSCTHFCAEFFFKSKRK